MSWSIPRFKRPLAASKSVPKVLSGSQRPLTAEAEATAAVTMENFMMKVLMIDRKEDVKEWMTEPSIERQACLYETKAQKSFAEEEIEMFEGQRMFYVGAHESFELPR